jgi:hypothetical protein
VTWLTLSYLEWTNHPAISPFVVVGVPLAFGLATEAFFEWRRRRRQRSSAGEGANTSGQEDQS